MNAANSVYRALMSDTEEAIDTNGKVSAQAKKKPKLDLATPRALLRKHLRIKKNGRVELKKGWSDKKIAKKAKTEIELVRRLRGDLYARIRVEVVREPVFEE